MRLNLTKIYFLPVIKILRAKSDKHNFFRTGNVLSMAVRFRLFPIG